MNTRTRHIALPLFAASLILVSASCSKKVPEPQTVTKTNEAENSAADAVSDSNDDSTYDKVDENDNDDSSHHCDKSSAFVIKDMDEFGKMHGIHEQLSKAKWADLEPKLPVSVLKAAPDENVIKKLESKFKLDCSATDDLKIASDGTSSQIIFCSTKKSKNVQGSEDGFEYDKAPKGFYYEDSEYPSCMEEYADYAYLSLISPKDHFARVYEIDTNLHFGYRGNTCGDMEHWKSLTLIEIESMPFLDTTGLFIRLCLSDNHGVEHPGFSRNTTENIYTTWLFAGDKQRLVAHWEDCKDFFEEEYNGDDDNEEEENN